MYRDNNFAIWLVSILILSLVGFAYAPIIMLFWNFLVVKILATASAMTYWQAYIVYLFFVVLPKLMPIRVTKNTNTKNEHNNQPK